MANTDIALVPNRPAHMSALSMFIAKHKRLPKSDGYLSRDDFKNVYDDGWEIGKSYLNREGHQVTVLTKDLAFMGFMSYVQYSNGAIRLIHPTEVLLAD
jgi:hypothetical protein